MLLTLNSWLSKQFALQVEFAIRGGKRGGMCRTEHSKILHWHWQELESRDDSGNVVDIHCKTRHIVGHEMTFGVIDGSVRTLEVSANEWFNLSAVIPEDIKKSGSKESDTKGTKSGGLD